MAQSSLNQIVSNAAGAVTGNTGAAPNVQGVVQSLASQSTADLTSALTQAAQQVAGLVSTNQKLVDTLNLNTAAVQAGASQSSSGGSAASTVGSIASAVLGGGLGLVPLISSIAGLFGGGSSAPPTLTKYAAPAAVDATLADTPGANNGLSSFPGVIYGQNGLPQAAPTNQTQTPAATASSASQITIQVNAIDSQSFMDHSYEIAQAVRSAMLNMSPINDVVSSL
jgi:hypothetical protein